MKIFIATPAFDGRVHVPYAVALSETVSLLNAYSIKVQFCITTSGSLLVAERNRLIKRFLESDCTHLLCIDSDLGWPAQAVKALLDHDMDFVAGLYPARGEDVFLFRPVFNEDKSIVKNDKNLLKMNYIPAGFMLIKRQVLEKMCEVYPQLYFKPKSKENEHEAAFCFFNTELMDGEFWGEDYVFCRRVREAGFDIWVDPLIEFDHAGKRGMLAQVLTNEKPKEEKS